MGAAEEKRGGEAAVEEGLTPPALPHSRPAPPLFWQNPIRYLNCLRGQAALPLPPPCRRRSPAL